MIQAASITPEAFPLGTGIHGERVSPYERAQRYLAKAGPALQGAGGYNHTGAAVWALVCKFDLTEPEYREILEEWNQSCDPPWEHRELIAALERALLRSDGHPDAQEKYQRATYGGSQKGQDRRALHRLTSLPPEWERIEPDPESLEPLRGVELLEGTPGAAYLQARGIPLPLARRAGVLYHPSFYGRPAAIFPVRNESRKLAAATGRYLDGQPIGAPKTRTAGPKRAGVFWTPGAFTADTLAITEGPMDALSLALCGIPALALLGTTWPAWLPLFCSWKRVLLATDADDAGDAAAEKLTAALRATGAKPERLTPSPAKDFNQALEWYGREPLRVALAARRLLFN